MARPKSLVTEISGIFTALSDDKQKVIADLLKAFASQEAIEDNDFEPSPTRQKVTSAKPSAIPAKPAKPAKPAAKAEETSAEEDFMTHKELMQESPTSLDDVQSIFATVFFNPKTGELTEPRNDKNLVRFLKMVSDSVSQDTLSSIKDLKALAADFFDVDDLLSDVGPTKRAEYIKNYLYACYIVFKSLTLAETDIDTIFSEAYEDVEADSVDLNDKARAIICFINGQVIDFEDQGGEQEEEQEEEPEEVKPRRRAKV